MTKPNIIASRIADFLKKHPPFESLSADDLDELSAKAVVNYFSAGDYIFKQGDSGKGFLYVVQEGVVHLELESNGTTNLVDICDEGELFGVRAMLSGKPYVFHARCEEETLVYGLPIDIFKKYLESNTKVALFFASGLAAGQTVQKKEKAKGSNSFKESGSLINWNRPLAKPSRTLITAKSTDSIQSVAQLMTEERVGSMIISDDSNTVLGIVTDTDFRSKLGTGSISAEEPITKLMTKGVFTMKLGLSLSTYLLEMLRRGIRHIGLIEDDKPIGILSEHDLLASQQNHPFTLSYSMEKASTVEELVQLRNRADDLVAFYLEQDVSISLVSCLISHINDTLIKRCIELALLEIGPAPANFCWLSLGSEGREEQLIRTDQDNALLYEDVDEDKANDTNKYFLKLANRVNQSLEKAGFETCPADMMAGNKKWCQPLSQWKKYFSGWITEPQEKALMLSTIFFDFRKVYGADSLVLELQNHLTKEIEKSKIFLNFLGANALKNPAPLSFFKNFVVERSGEHKDEFDIKARAMMPLIDIARLLVLSKGFLDETNTAKRYHWLAKMEPKNKEVFIQAAESYEYLMKFRALNGFQRPENKRYIQIDSLNKLDRLILRNTFEPINDLQKLVTVRFQLNYFN